MAKSLGKTSLNMEPNVAGLLSYLAGFITGIIFFVLEKDNKFVRFHAMQSIIVFGGLFVLQTICLTLVFLAILLPLINLIGVILWIILMVKAYQGEKFKLPIAGDMAEKHI